MLVFVMAAALFCAALPASADDLPHPVYRVDVNMMVLNFCVTDGDGHYVRGLRPENVRIREDDVPQTINSFTEAGERAPRISITGRNVFVLFDTSDSMYTSFPYTQEAIIRFIRELDPTDRVAVYTFSRNLYRAQAITEDHEKAIKAVRGAVAGDATALYNNLLLTLRDAANVDGTKVVVVFSNGADNGSIIGPDDVRRVAEEEGIPIYVVSARTGNPISSAAFIRLTDGTGGRIYYAKQWQDQVKAFHAIRQEFANSYTVTYYPAPNPNMGFRRIFVEVVDKDGSYQVRARPGYKPKRPSRVAAVR